MITMMIFYHNHDFGDHINDHNYDFCHNYDFGDHTNDYNYDFGDQINDLIIVI